MKYNGRYNLATYLLLEKARNAYDYYWYTSKLSEKRFDSIVLQFFFIFVKYGEWISHTKIFQLLKNFI